ncbi:MFS transporter [soil metagenome]
MAVTTPAEMPGKRQQLAARVIFFVAGIAMASWAPIIPLVKIRLHLTDGTLGWLLFCLGLGSILLMPFAGGFAARFGCQCMIVLSAAVSVLSLIAVAAAPNPALLAIALLAFGAGIGTLDVVMNIQAVIIERASGRRMMSGFHGMFSVGGLVAAAALTGILSAGIGSLLAMIIVAVVAAILVGVCYQFFLPYGGDSQSPAFALPRGHVLLIGALCFVLFMAEGSVADWGGVFLVSAHRIGPTQAGIGYLAFAICMTIGRLSGDKLVHVVGARNLLLFGGTFASIGYVVAALAPNWWLCVIGFGMVGAGASNVVPTLFSAAGRQRDMPQNLALSAVTTMGYLGLLIGPAVIGGIANALSLSVAFFLLVAMLATVPFCAKTVADAG